jgi:hypothetical protein
VEAQAGRIWIDTPSSSTLSGTTVAMVLPIAREDSGNGGGERAPMGVMAIK